jgi:hypothetical protein
MGLILRDTLRFAQDDRSVMIVKVASYSGTAALRRSTTLTLMVRSRA